MFQSGEAELATQHDIELLRRELKALESRMTIKWGVLLVVAVSIVAALVKLL